MKAVAAIETPPRYKPRSAQDDALRFAHTCYDHVAGQLGVAIADALVFYGHIILTEEGGEVTDAGSRFLTALGADLNSNSRSRRIFCRPCLDWSERRYHIAGLVGSEILRRCLELNWPVHRGVDFREIGRTKVQSFPGATVPKVRFHRHNSKAMRVIK